MPDVAFGAAKSMLLPTWVCREGANRAAALTQRLLAFSRQSPLSPSVLSLNELVSTMSELLRRTLGERVDLETVLGGGLWLTSADQNQVESAILTWLSTHATPCRRAENFTIETGNVHLDEGAGHAADETV